MEEAELRRNRTHVELEELYKRPNTKNHMVGICGKIRKMKDDKYSAMPNMKKEKEQNEHNEVERRENTLRL